MDNKKCSRCGETKPVSLFSPRKNRNPPYQSRCKACCAELSAAFRRKNPEHHVALVRARYRRNREKMLAATRKWRAENRAYVKERKKDWEGRNPDKVADMYRRKRAKGFGLTLNEYDAMYAGQRGCCAICGRHESEFTRKLNIDHDHETGKVRELLCTPCNVVIGHARDSVDVLNKAIAYLLAHRRASRGVA